MNNDARFKPEPDALPKDTVFSPIVEQRHLNECQRDSVAESLAKEALGWGDN